MKEYIFKVTEKDFQNRAIYQLLERLFTEKVKFSKDYLFISEAERKLLGMYKSEFVPVERYGQPKYKDEIGKFRGRRIIYKGE